MIIGQREEGDYDWDQSPYNQCWLLHRAIQTFSKAPVVGDILEILGGSAFLVSKHLAICAPGHVCQKTLTIAHLFSHRLGVTSPE